MKQYSCPHCGALKWVPSAECPDCGEFLQLSAWNVEDVPTPHTPANPGHVHLLGNTGCPIVYRRQPYPMEYGRQLLVTASSEGNYAGKGQFILSWEGTRCMISSGKNPACLTLVNEIPLSGKQLLQNGDTIQLQGKNSGRKAMTLVVIFDN